MRFRFVPICDLTFLEFFLAGNVSGNRFVFEIFVVGVIVDDEIIETSIGSGDGVGVPNRFSDE